MPKYNLTIIIPEIFEGTLAHWNDVFYTLPIPLDHALGTPAMCDILPCLGSIFEFCKKMEYDVEVRWIREI